MMRPFTVAALLIGLWTCGRRGVAEDYFFGHDNVMGTSLELIIEADDFEAARRAEDRALREIDRLSAIFSNHDPESEFRRWQTSPAGPSEVSAELFQLLEEGESWRSRSSGAFDPRVQALSSLWSEAARLDRLPNPDDLQAALKRLGRPAWRLVPAARTARRIGDDPMTLDAIAKGFIVERACESAMNGDPSIRALMLNVGGDLRVQGARSRTVAISGTRPGSESADPLAWVEVKDRAVATSGWKHRGYRIRGEWYSHIIDPRTGEPAGGVIAATVIAERSSDADALATILNVLTPAQGLRLADSLPGVACLIVDADGQLHRNAAWPPFERPAPVALARVEDPVPPKAEGGWGDDHELLVRFEINRPQEKGRYRRPYVAVWVQNEDGKPVRNLLFWVSMGGAGPFQWIPDLKRWHADDRGRAKAERIDVFQVAQPTRPPGEYSVVWDGKDDHGKPLKPGKYTVLIEAVREHGGYGLIRKQVTLSDDHFVEKLKGNDEIKSATLEYRPRDAKK